MISILIRSALRFSRYSIAPIYALAHSLGRNTRAIAMTTSDQAAVVLNPKILLVPKSHGIAPRTNYAGHIRIENCNSLLTDADLALAADCAERYTIANGVSGLHSGVTWVLRQHYGMRTLPSIEAPGQHIARCSRSEHAVAVQSHHQMKQCL